MSLQSTLAELLDEPVFDGQLYYIQAPDWPTPGPDLFAVFSIVGGQSFQSLDGDLPVSQPRVQVSVFSRDSLVLIEKVAAVQATMKAANDNDILLNYSVSVPVDGFEQDVRMYYSHLDFYCWQNDDI